MAATARTISGGQLHLVPYPLHGPEQGLRVGQFITRSSSTGIDASSEDFEFFLLRSSVMAVTSCRSEAKRWGSLNLDHVHALSAGLSQMVESASRTVIAITDMSATSASNSFKKGACQSEAQPNRG